MKVLVRSVIKCAPSDDPELMIRNFQALRESGIIFDIPEDEAIWNFTREFVLQHQHVPDVSSVKSYFDRNSQVTVLDRLDVVSVDKPKFQGDFVQVLDSSIEDRKIRKLSEIIKDTARVLDTGLAIKEGKGKPDRILKGPIQATRYFMDRSHEILTPNNGGSLYGDVTSDGESFKSEYERVKEDPLAGMGQLSGIKQMDEAIKGCKRGELWTHAAFTGGMKSTFAFNWVYNQAVYYRHSSVLFSLEMPYPQVRRILYSIHSCHPKFDDIRKKLGIGRSLDYEKIRDGELSPDAERFLINHVVPDFGNQENRYGKIHIEVADPDKSDYTVNDMNSRLQFLYQKDPGIRMVVADHAGLFQSRSKYNSTTDRLNEVLRDLKRLSMSFNRGMGIAIVALFQISREGYKAAEKSGGRYNLTHLSYANEAERSSDVVTAAWVDDELRDTNLVKFQCLKARDHKPFPDFYSGVLWPCRRVYTSMEVVKTGSGESKDIDLDV